MAMLAAGPRLAAPRAASRPSRALAAPCRRASLAAAPRRASPLAPPPRAAGGGQQAGDWFSEGKAKFFAMIAGSYDAAAVNAILDADLVPAAASGKGVVVYSWTTCPYCIKAKKELTDMGAKFTAVEINQLPEGKALKVELQKRTGQSSVPQVFIGGQFVGGCNNGPQPGMGLVPLKASGKLEAMLRAAGAL